MTDAEALELLYLMIAAGGRGWIPVVLAENPQQAVWIATGDRTTFLRDVPGLAWHDCTVALCPAADRGRFGLRTGAACVWARTETGRQIRELRRFHPRPTLVLREGQTVRYTALWALRKRLEPEDAERVGRHLAHRLRTPKKYASQDFRLRPPGAVVRYHPKVGLGEAPRERRPVPIVVAGGAGEIYPVGEVCRTLPRTIPDPDAWRSTPRKAETVRGAEAAEAEPRGQLSL